MSKLLEGLLSGAMENLYWLLPLAVLSVWVWLRFFYNQRMRGLLDLLPGPPEYPLIGNLPDIYVPDEENTAAFLTLFNKYAKNGIMKLSLGAKSFIFLFSVRASEAMLSNTSQITKASDYDALHPWLGTGLLTSTGNKWRSRRKLLTPAFHFRILEDFMGVYNEQSEILVQTLAKKSGTSSFDLSPFISRCTLDIICESAMGRNVNAQQNSDSPYVKAVNKMTWVVHTRNITPWLWSDWLFSLSKLGRIQKHCLHILHSFTKKVISERREELKSSESRPIIEKDDGIGRKIRLAFLDLLIQASEDGRVLSDLDIREEVDTFMFEGHDTTSSGLTSTLFLLGTHPEIQRKVQEELDDVLGDTGRRITLDDLKSLKYLECCIKESLRLFPPVAGIARRLSEEMDIDGKIIPAGVTLVLSIFMLHRDPEQWTDPEMYKPDRFLSENSVGRHPYAFVPFSAGPRNCIGQKFALVEEKVVLAHILRSYTVEAMEKVKPSELKIYTQLITRPQNGLKVKLLPRIKTDKKF